MKTSVNIKMEENVRDEAKVLFDSMGLDMTTAVNLFIRTVIKEQAIPFPIAATSEALQKRFEQDLKADILKSENDVKQGRMIDLAPAIDAIKEKYGI